MYTKILYLFVPLIFKGCLASMSHDQSQKLTDLRRLSEKLIWAARNGSLDVLTDLLKQGADVNARDNFGNTALQEAAREGHLDCLKALIEAKTDVNVRDSDGWTALHVAAWKGHLACLKALVEGKVDVNACDNKGETALHWAAWKGDLACVKVLIEAKVGVNARDNEGWTALHYAAWGDHFDCLKALIEGKADVNAPDNEGWTALHRAAERGHFNCVKTVVKYSYMLLPLEEVVTASRKRIFSVLLLFARLRKPHEEGGLLFKDLGNTSLQFEILSKSELLQYDLVFVFLDELEKGREIKPGLLSRSKEAVVEFLLKKVTEIVSSMKVTSMKDEMRDLLSDAQLEELIREGLDEKINRLKSKESV